VALRAAEVIARFNEVESGKLADQLELGKAPRLAKITGAVLLIAKLDRLSRNAAFLLTLRNSGVRFVAADMARCTRRREKIRRSTCRRS
jgi:DNA invertase Pin-like site-specific DNA recombinase